MSSASGTLSTPHIQRSLCCKSRAQLMLIAEETLDGDWS